MSISAGFHPEPTPNTLPGERSCAIPGVALRPIDWHPIQRKKRGVTCGVRKWLTSVRTGHVVRSLPRKLHNRLQTTMIFVTHEQTEAMTMGDRSSRQSGFHFAHNSESGTAYKPSPKPAALSPS